MTTLILGFLIARNATIEGNHVVWSCTFQTSTTTITVQQLQSCEPVKSLLLSALEQPK